MRKRNLAVVVAIAALSMVGAVQPASASTTIPCGTEVPCLPVPLVLDTSAKSIIPGAVAAVLLNSLVPEPRATAMLSWDLQQIQNSAANPGSKQIVAGVNQTITIVKHIPVVGDAFSLGLKGGGWVDSFLGISTGADPSYVTNSDVPADPNGWSPLTWPWSITTCGSYTCTETNIHPNIVTAPTYGETSTALGSLSNTNAWLSETFTQTLNSAPFSMVQMQGVIYCKNSGGTVVTGSSWGLPTTGGYSASSSSGTLTVTPASNEGLSCPAGDTFDHLTVTQLSEPWTSTVFKSDAWYPVGHPSRPAPPNSNPRREWEMDTVCHDGASTAPTLSAVFHETDSTWPGQPQYGDCSADGGLHSWMLLEDNLDTGTHRTVSSYVVPSSLENLSTTYSECLTLGSCVTTLWKLDTTVTPNVWNDCFTHGDDCAQWATDPSRTSDYKCTYGTPSESATAAHDVGLSGCYQYGTIFDTRQRNAGNVFTDPSTDPGTGTPVTSSPSGNMNETTTAPVVSPDANYCNFSWSIAFNPVQWVVQPLECLFIPKTSQITALTTGLKTSLDNGTVGPWVTAFGSVLPTGGSGCTGPDLDLSSLSAGFDLHPLDACSGTMQVVAGIVNAVATVGIVVGGAWSCLVSIQAGFGYKDD